MQKLTETQAEELTETQFEELKDFFNDSTDFNNPNFIEKLRVIEKQIENGHKLKNYLTVELIARDIIKGIIPELAQDLGVEARLRFAQSDEFKGEDISNVSDAIGEYIDENFSSSIVRVAYAGVLVSLEEEVLAEEYQNLV